MAKKKEKEPVATEVVANGDGAADEPIAEPAESESAGSESAASGTKAAADNAELEARAIAQAMQSADASYVPSPSLLASDEPEPLLSQVDGPSLADFSGKPSVYQAKSVPVALRSKFDVPIHVTAGGSVVEYEISTDEYDVAFGVTAEREEGVTNVKESSRVDSHLVPVTGKFLVGSVPCALVFSFDNEYSWFREKRVTYKITVTPPRTENVIKGRRLRAKKALEVVTKDGKEIAERYENAMQKRAELEADVKKLEKEVAERKKSLDVVSTEEKWLERKRVVRDEQIRMLNMRLEKGWDDEKSEA
mmetsp:Transcript_5574/g.12212  ORF Transcript_5574/g.12212 Transcript_5574/m.12212 type:complete len:305 (-) Transcript_5574:334-1248(-)|eukprot:CAMPEP_0172550898 /NCGR_PEP_ID=MMETSP1067-20121228/33402_1 /TAXON_ID=265564 ORGANISM="Thalassiosira punctigera, Strain Tpunct2005C2" /NCGR_SAMPLE_ID=MMETSP1067 /ASSEMBLY_ACC=CAM_ASM_000444 /LENGTH=304 /DNA_ID=CAMNT_0013338579 /DNA_START=185 /DNA_END=1099 /DNA_ORIENTATION=+